MNNAPQRKAIQTERERGQHDNPNYQNQWGENRHAYVRMEEDIQKDSGHKSRTTSKTRQNNKTSPQTRNRDNRKRRMGRETRERAYQALLRKNRIVLSPPLLISYFAQERNRSKASKLTRKCYSARSTFRKNKRASPEKRNSEQCVVVRPISPSFHILSYSCSLSKVTDQHDHTQRRYSQDVWPLFS